MCAFIMNCWGVEQGWPAFGMSPPQKTPEEALSLVSSVRISISLA